MAVLHGATRTVLLIGRWAVKLPRLGGGYRSLLYGLLANHQEVQFRNLDHKLCPVRFWLPFGLLVVMPRVSPLAQELTSEEYEAFVECEDYVLPVESKADSFGWLGDRLVAIDYGS